MDFVPPMLVLITFALVFGSIVRTWIVHRSLRENARAHVDLQSKLIERFGSADEMLRYLESEPGRRLLEGATTGPDRPRSRVLDALHLGILLLAGGFGLIGAAQGVDVENMAQVMGVLGKIAVFLGFGFLGSAFLTSQLAGRWGLIKSRDTEADIES